MKAFLRKLTFKTAPLFKNSGERFIRMGYFIHCSTWLKKYNVYYSKSTSEIREYLIEKENVNSSPVDFFEFGVSEGWGLRNWLKLISHENSRFFGFDTFEGIPDDWGSVKKGAYSNNGIIPDIKDPRCSFYKGLFQESLPKFIEHYKLGNRKIIHLDADLYVSTIYVLIQLQHLIKIDDIIVFDEFFSVTKADHEFRAFEDFCNIYNFKFEAIAASPNQFAIKVV